MGREFWRGGVVAIIALVGLVRPVVADPPAVVDLTPPGLGDIVPPVRPHTETHEQPKSILDGGWYTSAEALILRPRRGAFDYATPNHTNTLVAEGATQSLNYELRAGVRGELGYRFSETGWDVLGGYTYFRSGVQQTAIAGAGEVLVPTLTRPGLVDRVNVALADANLEYNVFDIELGKRFTLDEHFAVRAFGGLRFASIRQNFQAYYDGRDALAAAVFVPSNFQGFGPIAGGEAIVTAWHGFHLYGRMTGGLLTGPSTNPLFESNNSGATIYANTSYDVRKVVPVVSLGVGAGWQHRTLSIRMGYEVTQWFGLIDQPRFTDDAARGKFVSRSANLSLEGLFVQVGLVF